MAVTFDAASAPAAVTATSLTFSHNCVSNASLAVGVATNNATGATGVTYNGVAMTLELSNPIPALDTVEVWKLDAPASGANNVVVTCATSRDIIASGVSVTGAYLADCSLANAESEGSSTAPSVAVTSVAGDLVMSYCVSDSAVTHAPGANETERADVTSPSGLRASLTTKDPTGASETMSRTLGATEAWGIVAMSFRAAGRPQKRGLAVPPYIP